MCKIIYEICGKCFSGHAQRLEPCEHFHPPHLRCPEGTKFEFGVSTRQCHLPPDHNLFENFHPRHEHNGHCFGASHSCSVFEKITYVPPWEEDRFNSKHHERIHSEKRAQQGDNCGLGDMGTPICIREDWQRIESTQSFNGSPPNHGEYPSPAHSRGLGQPHHQHQRIESPRALPDSNYRANRHLLHNQIPGTSQPPSPYHQTQCPPGFTYVSVPGSAHCYPITNRDQILPRHLRSQSIGIYHKNDYLHGNHWKPPCGPLAVGLGASPPDGFKSRDEARRDNLEQLRRSNEAAYYTKHYDGINESSQNSQDEAPTTWVTSAHSDSPRPMPPNAGDAHSTTLGDNQSSSKQRGVSAPNVLQGEEAIRSPSPLWTSELPASSPQQSGASANTPGNLDDTVWDINGHETQRSQTKNHVNSSWIEEATELDWEWGEVACISRLNSKEELTQGEVQDPDSTPTEADDGVSMKGESDDEDHERNIGSCSSGSVRSDPENEVKLYEIPLASYTRRALNDDLSERNDHSNGIERRFDEPTSPRESLIGYPQDHRTWSDIVSGRNATSTSSDSFPAQPVTDTQVHATDPANALGIALRQLTDTLQPFGRATKKQHDQHDNAAAIITPKTQSRSQTSELDSPGFATEDVLRGESTAAAVTQPSRGANPATIAITGDNSQAVQTMKPAPMALTPAATAPSPYPGSRPQRTWSQLLFSRPGRPKKLPNPKPKSESSSIDETNWPSLGSYPGPSKSARKRNPSS